MWSSACKVASAPMHLWRAYGALRTSAQGGGVLYEGGSGGGNVRSCNLVALGGVNAVLVVQPHDFTHGRRQQGWRVERFSANARELVCERIARKTERPALGKGGWKCSKNGCEGLAGPQPTELTLSPCYACMGVPHRPR